MAVAAMRAGDLVAVVEMHTYAGGYSFLAGVKMHETRDFTGSELDMDAVFEFPDQLHRPVRS